ncbi:hypothetical protein E4U55_000289 [Claviceps digitariae]|nr:hypothetical protein E4U55_000289 [Claviceps digitariae]
MAYQKWQNAVSQGFGANSVPLIYLLGLKKDLRMECSFEDHRLAMETGLTVGSPSCCVNPRDASWHAKRIGAERYAECSALTGDGVDHVIEEVSRLALEKALENEAASPLSSDHNQNMITSAALTAGILAVVTVSGALVFLLASCVQSWSRAILTILTGLASICICVTTRHFQLTQSRRSRAWPSQPHTSQESSPDGDPPRIIEDYYLFVLGSGGHTKEMLMMMDDGTRDFGATHRRYLISSGDGMSENHLEDYEAELKTSSASPGTYDKCIVTRARRVHQPLWSTPWTSLLSFLDIFPVLLVPPKTEGGEALKVRYPGMIFSNGPATGFFVALAVHTLKMLGVVPEERMRFVYIESWARISTLSLTGKLLFYTGIADAFYVQHEEVAAKYGLVNAREMVFNARRLD